MRSSVEVIIRSEIELVFGRKIISSRDCIQLSDEAFRVTKMRLSPNTIRRFFGLVKTGYSPSHSTTLILCNYCGFHSIEEAENYGRVKSSFEHSAEEKSLLKYLVNLFSETPEENEPNETFKSVVKQTILFLNQHPKLAERFQSMVAKTKNGQDYYFEDFIYVDKLNSFYGDGLRHYLNEKNEPEAQTFGNALLVFRYWLTEDEHNLDRHFKQMNSNVNFPPSNKTLPARYFACLLYYCHAKEVSSVAAMASIREYYSTIGKEDMDTQLHFEITIAEAFILTGIYKEGLVFADRALEKFEAGSKIEESILHTVHLLKSFALNKIGLNQDAREIYQQIRPSSFNFLHKKMQTILYGILSSELQKSGAVHIEQTGLLIQETGFSRLAKLSSFSEIA